MGEKFIRIIEHSLKTTRPLLIFSASGGCRMQEGLTSLMQMGKICVGLEKLSEKRIPYISILCHPTSGGVAASFSILGDINIAEPNVIICFAGPRVVQATLNEKIPMDFLTSEAVFQRGLLDCIVERNALRKKLSEILLFLKTKKRLKRKKIKKESLFEYSILTFDKPIHLLCEKLEKLEKDSKNKEQIAK